MRILYCDHTSAASGAEASVGQLVRVLASRHTVAVACPRGGRAEHVLVRNGAQHFDIPESAASSVLSLRATPRDIETTIRAAAALRAVARRFRPDVIHANGTRAGLLVALSGCRRLAPIVTQIHDHLPTGVVGEAVRGVLTRTSSAIVVPSHSAAASFASGRTAGTNPSVVYSGIDLDCYRPDVEAAPLRSQIGVESSARLIGQVGQITPWKRQDFAIQLLSKLRDRYPQLHLVIVGEMTFRSRTHKNEGYIDHLNALIQRLELTARVHFIGFRDDIPNVMRSLDVVIMPSHREPFGLVALESAAVGTPTIIGSDSGASELLIDGETAVIAESDVMNSWVQGTQALLDDGLFRERIAGAGLLAAKEFGAEQYAATVAGIYGDLILRPLPSRWR